MRAFSAQTVRYAGSVLSLCLLATGKKLTGEESESVHVNEKTCSFVLLNGQR